MMAARNTSEGDLAIARVPLLALRAANLAIQLWQNTSS